MTLKSMIELADGLTPIETEIGYYVLRNQEDILDMSVVELAGKSSVECPHGFYKQRLTALASNPKHAAIILSYSGKATFVKPILKVLYQKKVPVIYVGKAGGNLYPQYVTCALTISSRENLRDRISQFSSHIAMQYMMDVVFGCVYNMDREKNIEYLK